MMSGATVTAEGAIHLVSSDSAAGCLLQLGVKRAQIRIAMDYLTVGPCDRDPERHRELRRAWAPVESMGPYGFDDVGAAMPRRCTSVAAASMSPRLPGSGSTTPPAGGSRLDRRRAIPVMRGGAGGGMLGA
jgi:hypothetical protein